MSDKPSQKHTKWTDETRRKFLKQLARTGNATFAARSIGISRARAFELKREDAKFASAWKKAIAEAADNLEHEAYRRAVEGVDEPVFFQGMECGVVRKYSDSLLTLLLKHTKRRKYMDRSEQTLNATHTVRSAEELSDEELAVIAAQGLTRPKGQ